MRFRPGVLLLSCALAHSAVLSAEPVSFWSNLKLDLRDARHPSRTVDSPRRTGFELGLGLAAIGASAAFDVQIRDRYVRSTTPSNLRFARAVRPLGEGGGLALLGLSWGIGRLTHQDRWVELADDGFEATLLSAGVLAPLLKETVGRSRPSAHEGSHSFHPFSGNASFPSGESTEAFAIASVVAAHYRQPWIRIVAWGSAALVASNRLRQDAHWASDVVAGGLLGGAVGTWVVHQHQRRASASASGPTAGTGEAQWVVTPILGLPGDRHRRPGLQLTVVW